MLVWGADDRTVPIQIGKLAKEAISGARLAVIENAAHTVYFEKPAAFNRLLIKFLSGDDDLAVDGTSAC